LLVYQWKGAMPPNMDDLSLVYVLYTDMRFEFEKSKSQAVKRKHGVSLKEAQEIFDQAYLVPG
jgi:hypothetical protein